jgi:cytochrome c oxidase subunit 2
MSAWVRLLIPATALLLAGCGSAPQNFVWSTGGPAAAKLAQLGWFGIIAFSAATVIVWLLILWLALRRRGTLAEHAPFDANGGQSWILVGGFAIPAAVFAFLFAATLGTLSAFPMSEQPGKDPPQIVVTGHQWWFQAVYRFPGQSNLDISTATELHIPTGRPITIQLQSQDVIHSFWIPKLHGKVDMIPGQQNYIRIQADKPGLYQGECAEFCGAEHAMMRLLVVAQTPENYQRWLEAQRAPAHEPTDPDAVHGKGVFLTAACPLCHTVRGTGALGNVGPDLTHIGSRETIAGGAYANNKANLEAWITHAQSLKPGVQMPNLTAFKGKDLRSLADYLESLR